MREGGRPAGFKGRWTKRCVNEWKEVYLNPETGITTYTESGFGSRFGIPHYSSVFVAKIRISPCRQSSASEHCGNRDIGFMDVSSRRLTFPGPQVSPSGEVKGERATNRETRPLTRRAAQAGPGSKVCTNHETRNTNNGFFSKHGFFRITALTAVRVAMGAEESHHEKLPPGRCFPARCGAAWAAWGAPSNCPRTIRTSNRAFRVFTKQETRDPAIARRAA